MDLIKDHKTLIEDIAATIETVRIVVLDTLNRSLVGAENRDEDMSAYFNAADAIREAFDCVVIIVHHCGIDGTRPRGHTSLTCNAEFQWMIKRDSQNNSVLKVEYIKDGAEGDEIASRIKRVSLGDDDEGDEIWSCVIDPVGDYVKPVVMPKAAPLVLQALREAVAANDDSVDLDTWRKAAMKKNITDGKTERARQKMFSKCVEALIQSKKAIEDAGQYDFA